MLKKILANKIKIFIFKKNQEDQMMYRKCIFIKDNYRLHNCQNFSAKLLWKFSSEDILILLFNKIQVNFNGAYIYITTLKLKIELKCCQKVKNGCEYWMYIESIKISPWNVCQKKLVYIRPFYRFKKMLII